MKRSSILLRSIAGAFLAAVFAFTFILPVPVSSSSFVIDDSVFGSYDIDQMTVWYWREGLPPCEHADSTKYPVVIAWDNGKYFFTLDQTFLSREDLLKNVRSYNGDLPVYSYEHPDLAIANGFYPAVWIGKGGWAGDPLHWVDGYAPGYYRHVCSFPASQNGMTAKLPFDFNTLVEQGTMVSLQEVNVPYLVPQGREGSGNSAKYKYAMGVKLPSSLQSNSRYYSADHQYAWIMMQYLFEAEKASRQEQQLYGEVKYYHTTHFAPYFTDSLTNFSTRYNTDGSEVVNMYSEDGTQGWNDYVWKFYSTAGNGTALPEGRYAIQSDANWTVGQQDIGGDWQVWSNLMIKSTDIIKTRLEWNGNSLRTQANRDEKTYNETDSKAQFQVFYATPVVMDVINTSFTVEKGQVVNLDGPILINSNCTITVKEGGTLTVSAKSEANGVDLGWVMNNGKIKIEKGGTLYIQKGACLNKYNNKSNAGGGVISEGLVIVDEDAKLCGGGVDGLQFKNGSHVINYGAIISENFLIEKDHTIENRGDKAVVFHGKGNGVTGSGYGLFMGEVTSSGFPERGTLLDTVSDNVNEIPNGIYTW